MIFYADAFFNLAFMWFAESSCKNRVKLNDMHLLKVFQIYMLFHESFLILGFKLPDKLTRPEVHISPMCPKGEDVKI